MPALSWIERARERPAAAAAVLGAALAWALSVILLYHRLPFGAGYGDEAYYNAMPYPFALGNRPYVDELGVFQNAGVMLTPFYRAYLAIHGSADGIIMFNRHLYFVYVVSCSLVAYSFVKRISNTATGYSIAALVAPFGYFNILAVSYNSCGAFGLFCGSLCTASAMLTPRPARMLFAASLLFLSAMFGYPGMTPVVALYLPIAFIWMYRELPRESFKNGLLGLAAGALVALLAFSYLALHVGKAGFEQLLAFSRAMGYGTQGVWERLSLMPMFKQWGPMLLGYLALFIALPLLCVLLQRALWVVALLAAVSLAACYQRGLEVFAFTPATICLTVMPVLAPLCVALNRRWKFGRLLLALVWAPSFVSMVTICYTSSNQFHAMSLGSLGALVSGVVSFGALLEALAERTAKHRSGARLVFASFLLSLFIIQIRSLYATVYAEVSVMSMCDTRVHAGPLKGTLTSKDAAQFLETIDRDLKAVAQRFPAAKTLTVFDNFSVAYMSTRLKPRTFTNWILWDFFPANYARAIAKENFGTVDQLPDVLLTIHPVGRSYWQNYIRGHYRAVIRRPAFDYVILRKLGKRTPARDSEL